MPTLAHGELHALLRRIFVAAGVPNERADTVATHLVGAHLAGHDSHGAIRAAGYVDLIERGALRPDAPIEVSAEGRSTAVVDGHGGFGFVVTSHAVDLAVEKARTTGVGAVTVRRQGHMGRLGAYTADIAGRGLIGLVMSDAGSAPRTVAPHGGRARRLGTNPLSIALPADVDAPVVLDMATSTAARGKVLVAAARGERIPQGWVLDAEGNPTDDPAALEAGGALLPFGADQAHKGYGLSFMIQALAGLLSASDHPERSGPPSDGAFVAAFGVDRFRPLEAFRRDVADFVAHLKQTPRAAGCEEILHPGEVEHRTAGRRLAEGIPLDETTWGHLTAVCERLGLPAPRAPR